MKSFALYIAAAEQVTQLLFGLADLRGLLGDSIVQPGAGLDALPDQEGRGLGAAADDSGLDQVVQLDQALLVEPDHDDVVSG